MEERFITLRDGHRLFFRLWCPETEPIATIHILHGMAEHSLRYNDFALYLNSLGFVVYAQDHRGHGFTKEENEKGWFADREGWLTVAKDSFELDRVIFNEFEDLPHYLMGHSMGSFMARSVITMHPSEFDGLIIMGSGASKGIVGKVGKSIALSMAKKYGSRLPNSKLDKLSFGSFNSKIKNPRTPFDWLSRDEKEVDKYINDPLCGFICSSMFYSDLIDGIEMANDVNLMKKIPASLPILIISGDADPVGGYGNGVKKFAQNYKKAGIKDVTLKLVEGGRHEILNETDKQDTYNFIGSWLMEKVNLING